jgi:hypothetical protein
MIPLKRGLAKYSLTSSTFSSCSLITVKVLIGVSWHNGLDIQRKALQPSRDLREEASAKNIVVSEDRANTSVGLSAAKVRLHVNAIREAAR